jgi:hypothetical protein
VSHASDLPFLCSKTKVIKVPRSIALFALMLCLPGCWGLLGRALVAEELAIIGARGGLARASVAGMSAALGGEAIAATRFAQANMGSIIASDFAVGRLATNSIRLQIGEGAASINGRAIIKNGGVNVTLVDGLTLRVTSPKPSQTATGLFSEHYIGAKRVSYARLSPDGIRYDYFVRTTSNQFERALYALRDPSGKSIAFFGPNHSYLGKAIYRMRAGDTAGVGALAAATVFVSMTDFRTTPYAETCAQELVNLRLTYFNKGIASETPDQFWESIYKDCSRNNSVLVDYQDFRMGRIYAIADKYEKLIAAKRFLLEFPKNKAAKNLMNDLEGAQ